MRSHRPHTYSRFARIRRRLLALRFAPTIAEGLDDVEIRAQLRPLVSGLTISSSSGRVASTTARLTTHP